MTELEKEIVSIHNHLIADGMYGKNKITIKRVMVHGIFSITETTGGRCRQRHVHSTRYPVINKLLSNVGEITATLVHNRVRNIKIGDVLYNNTPQIVTLAARLKLI